MYFDHALICAIDFLKKWMFCVLRRYGVHFVSLMFLQILLFFIYVLDLEATQMNINLDAQNVYVPFQLYIKYMLTPYE